MDIGLTHMITTFPLAIAAMPMIFEPISIPAVIFCLYPLELKSNFIVNGFFDMTLAKPFFNNPLALAGEQGIKGFFCLFKNKD
ncbi:MAG: hypothetical protein KR126chlam5_00747 [Candidatus Anoxychlamydiales bacterium]|nr:hypothetical protein [Candidatus Anoxychlamydiales bacterium]